MFDAYLDGELSPAMETELGAHRLRCPDCRRALALLEVTGHILESDEDPVLLNDGFSDRLLACMDERRSRWTHRVRRGLYIAGPLAAAAVVVMAFLGSFDRQVGVRAGQEATWSSLDGGMPLIEDAVGNPVPEVDDPTTQELDQWGRQFLDRLDTKRRSGESLQRALDGRILDLIDVLEQAEVSSGVQEGDSPADDVSEASSPHAGAVPDSGSE